MKRVRSAPSRRRSDIDCRPENLDQVAINVKSRKLLNTLLRENGDLEHIMQCSKNEIEAMEGVRHWILRELEGRTAALDFYHARRSLRGAYEKLQWEEIAAIRILDYLDHAGMEYSDLNLRGEMAVNNPIKMIWLAVHRGTGGAKPPFFEDMIHLFRQFRGEEKRVIPPANTVERWMERYPSGLDPRIVKLREENRERILRRIIRRIDKGEVRDTAYSFDEGAPDEEKMKLALQWWQESRFHLRFAARSADTLNEMLGKSLDPDTMKIFYAAERAGIPFFVNPYYLSLLHVRVPYFAVGADLAIRDYVMYSRQLVEEFGHIVAWEKEDLVVPGEPNAAGWLLPSEHNVHRRYPEVAILIPDTVGRACGGLCASCQRMYNFQKGILNFDLEKLRPQETWPQKLERLMEYFENDSQLKDILITGGDALMSSDRSIGKILDAVCSMALRKREANRARKDGEKYAEIVRVRLGTRLPVYLPQRITDSLVKILGDFRKKAAAACICQFVIQTHFESPMEVTPEARESIGKLLSAGWMVTNQHVLTAASSRRGHTVKLRQVLNEVGIVPYYTFTPKGYMENQHNFTINARAVQEQQEEKILGRTGKEDIADVTALSDNPGDMVETIAALRRKAGLPFLATDRNVLNLPAVGKSLTFRVIGITRYGRRILEFEHDPTRRHSPIIEKTGKVIIIESKSVSEYLLQLEEMGEDTSEYEGIYGYSIGETDTRAPIFEYPGYDFDVTDEFTNLQV
jgi:lysine 2,3-aminomutase